MTKRSFLADVLSAHVPLKRVCSVSARDDVTIGPCLMCIDRKPVNLRKTDKVMLKEFFSEKNDISVCDNCSITLAELHQLKLQKIKIEKRIEQIIFCIKAVVFKNASIVKDETLKNLEASADQENFSVGYQSKSIEKRKAIKKESYRKNDEIRDVPKDPTVQLLIEGANTINLELELTDAEIDEDAENQKIKTCKLRVRQRCKLCGKSFPHSSLRRHLANGCNKRKLPGTLNTNLKTSNKQSYSKHAEKMNAISGVNKLESRLKNSDGKLERLNPGKSFKILKKVINKTKLCCNVCKRNFFNHTDAFRHKKSKICWKTNYISLKETFEKFCGICRIAFATKEELKGHKVNGICEKEHSRKGFCGHCGGKFNGRSEVFRHIKSGQCRYVLGRGK